ncbi:hypothetical protein ACHAQA_005124 [Verticillium albo-atrum]
MTGTEKLTVGVIGPAGFGGSYLCMELVGRGHKVVGLSRHPEKLGKHPAYEPRPWDLEENSEAQLAEGLKGLDAVVCMYGPHTAGTQALRYMPFIETTRKIILVIKRAAVPYFVMVGGTGSLHVPDESGVCAADSKHFFLAYRRGIADSEAHVAYMEERLPEIGKALRKYRNARQILRDRDALGARAYVEQYETRLRQQQDAASEFIKAARASYMFFDGNTSFNWTYASPSALYRPGLRTGTYTMTQDDLPLKSELSGDENPLDGRLLGVSAADFAVALADEVETRKNKYLHWTATADLSDDTPRPSYLTFKAPVGTASL